MENVLDVIGSALHWESWLAAGVQAAVLSVLVWIWVRYRQFDVSRKPLVWAGVFLAIFLVLGIVGSYRTEREEAGFRLEIVNASVAGSPDGALVLLKVGVTNVGAPSVVTGWHVYAQLPDRDEIEMVIGGQDSIVIGDSTYRGNQLIYTRSINTPIARGDRIVGLLLCKLFNIPENYLTQPGVSFRVLIGDVYGNEYNAIRRVEPPFRRGSLFIPGSDYAVNWTSAERVTVHKTE